MTSSASPHQILDRIAQMYPDIDIEHEWADEDIGSNCGRYTYHGGERAEEYYTETSKDCMEFAARVMSFELQDIGLYLNASGNEYIPLDDREFEVVKIAGKKAFFTTERLTDNDIPKGLFCYHLRENDEGNGFASIEKNVKVNHGGSVLFNEPLNLGKDGYIAFDDVNIINFLGETATLAGTMNIAQEEDSEMEMKGYD